MEKLSEKEIIILMAGTYRAYLCAVARFQQWCWQSFRLLIKGNQMRAIRNRGDLDVLRRK